MLSCFICACRDRLRFTVILAGLFPAPLLVPSAGATPPTPPAELLELERGALERLQARGGAFAVPLQLRLNEEAGELSLRSRKRPGSRITTSRAAATSRLALRSSIRRQKPPSPAAGGGPRAPAP